MFGFLSWFSRPRSSHPPRPALSAQWLVVGLGNPGAKYAATRHNIGYMALDVLHPAPLPAVNGIKVTASAVDAVAYARPTTHMNLSGEAVAPLARELGIPPERIIVLHDELDLPPGKVRVRIGGSENGHNGLKSISEHLGTRDYVRARIGIGRPPKGTPVPDWVLAPVDGDVTAQVELAAEAVRLIVAEGISQAQNRIHSR
ncbi:aminoacyl-tRNA hydrolase [Corynebacterium sp. LK2510]|uniref:aminoacyl-tRNA hydrolase n=1 Tax=Corynebacterium sp. LK2510 TaxID=3110472 RepID=UPI0034CDA1A1